ncbi:hypothetical protein ACA910_021100 [Epithemia clementina (nom. ined.)]
MQNNFEAAAAHLLPYDPVAKKRSAGVKRGAANISAVDNTEEILATTAKKPSIGRTCVHLRYHKMSEYKALTSKQKDELQEWRSNNSGEKPALHKKAEADPTKKSKTFTKKQVAAMVAKQVEAELKKKGDDGSNDYGKHI